MMTDVERAFFSLLRQGLWGERAACGEVDAGDGVFEGVFRLACRQAVSGIVADGVAVAGLRPGEGLWRQWVMQLLHIEMMNERVAKCGERLVGWLASEGITASVFKGASVAKWYRNPLRRSYGDIDLVVSRGWDLVEPLLRRKELPFCYESGDIVVSGVEPFQIEFHRWREYLYNPFADARLRRMLEADAGGVELYVACLVLHLRRHALSYGVGMKQVCDVAVMMRRAGVDRSRLEAVLRRLGAWRFGRVLLRFVSVYLYGENELGANMAADKDVALLYSVIMGDGYELKFERERDGRRVGRSAVRVVENGLFFTGRSLRLFRLMPSEAFFFVCRKAVDRLFPCGGRRRCG